MSIGTYSIFIFDTFNGFIFQDEYFFFQFIYLFIYFLLAEE